ncbi:Thrombospondin type-1 (TSP1) repeat [Trinorchestia longiramus]|nr:Thrombospondin type-1 (TSP1) repeat [Trinorchestia longiramus]
MPSQRSDMRNAVLRVAFLILSQVPAAFGKVGSREIKDPSQSPFTFSPEEYDSSVVWTTMDRSMNTTEVDGDSANSYEGATTEADEDVLGDRAYEVLGPGHYTALQGPLTVTVLAGNRHRSSFIGPRSSEFLQLSVRLLHSSEELGGRTIGPVVEGVHLTTSLPCGVVSIGGTHVIRLSRKATILTETIVLVKWPRVLVHPPTAHHPIMARLESKCRPLPRPWQLQACAELLHHGNAARLHPVMLPLQRAMYNAPSLNSSRRTVSPLIESVLNMNNFSSDQKAGHAIHKEDENDLPTTLQQKRNLISASLKPGDANAVQVGFSSSIDSNNVDDILHPQEFLQQSSDSSEKFCEPPGTVQIEYNDVAVVVDRVRLAALYSSGEAAVWFDCRHLSDGEVYSTRITVRLPASPVLANSPNFMIQWSTMASLNISVRYMKECHGSVAVRTQHKLCRSTLNKIRVYAMVPFNVESVNPPVEEKYMAEYRVKTLPINIPCSLFTERPSQYCFVYVNIASSGAVTEVARECRPTLRPGVSVRHGVWSSWSSWSECVPHCGVGQQIRYRYCDSPPPLNKGAYCQGNATAVKYCSNPPCDLPSSSTSAPVRHLEDRFAECNCGCQIRVTSASSLLVDVDTSSCGDNASWLIKAEDGESVMVILSRTSLLAEGQWMKVRDGNLTISPILLTLPTIPPHRTHGIFLAAHTLAVTNLTGVAEEKHWDQFGTQRSKSDPWWLIRSSAEWLRLEMHSFSNSSNKTGNHFGFTLLARSSGAEWPHPIEELLFSHKEQTKGTSYESFVNYFALFFIVLILCFIVMFVVAFCVQYRLYRHSKMDTDSLRYSIGSSCDLDIDTSPNRFVSLLTIAEVLSMASFNFNRRDNPGNYTQLTDRNCVPLRSKRSGCMSMPSSPFCGRAPLLRPKNLRECESKRRSASCEELESRFIFPIKEENVMTTSVSEIEMSSSCKEDSGNDSPTKISTKRSGKKSVIKKPHTIKGSFACVTRVKNLTVSMLPKSNPNENDAFTKRMVRRKLSLKQSACGNKQSPTTKISSVTNIHSSSTSELSVNGADLEFDYYDYNMENASAVPGSLFGLDPTLMPWLPSILNISEVNEEMDTYTSQSHPFSVSESTLTRSVTDIECIPLQDMSQLTAAYKEKKDLAPNGKITASKAISLSSSSNSDEIRFADDSEEE